MTQIKQMLINCYFIIIIIIFIFNSNLPSPDSRLCRQHLLIPSSPRSSRANFLLRAGKQIRAIHNGESLYSQSHVSRH